MKRIKTKGFADSRQGTIHEVRKELENKDIRTRYGGFTNVHNQEMFVIEKEEHPTFTDKQIRQVVLDHLSKEHGRKIIEEAEKEGNL